MRIFIAISVVAVLLSGCPSTSTSSSSSSSSTGNTPNASTSGVVVENILVDAAAVSQAAPPADADIAGCEPEATTEIPSGLLVYQEGDEPVQLVVFTHGFGHTVEASWLPHMRRFVRPGLALVSTNYRDNFGFPILRGAHDSVAATLMALERFPSIETVYLLGVSMGGAIAGTAIVESTHVNDGRSLYDYWVMVEGVSQLAETWAAATAIAATGNETGIDAAAGIERDAGGTPVECLQAYARRSPGNNLNTWAMADAGLLAAAVIHPLNDGLVPYNHGREMAQALVTAGIPTQFFTILGVEEGQEHGTTGTSALQLGALDPLLNLAGHGSEADETHPVMRVGFEQLALMLSGDYDDMTPYQEHIVDPTVDGFQD